MSPKKAKRLDAILRPFEEAGEYLTKNYDALLAENEDKWVALYGPELVASSKRRSDVYRTLRAKHIPIEHAYVKFLTKKKRVLIL